MSSNPLTLDHVCLNCADWTYSECRNVASIFGGRKTGPFSKCTYFRNIAIRGEIKHSTCARKELSRARIPTRRIILIDEK